MSGKKRKKRKMKAEAEALLLCCNLQPVGPQGLRFCVIGCREMLRAYLALPCTCVHDTSSSMQDLQSTVTYTCDRSNKLFVLFVHVHAPPSPMYCYVEHFQYVV